MSKLADTAVQWVMAGRGELRPGYCSRWVRQVAAATFAGKFDDLFGSTAKETGQRLRAAGYAVSGSPQVGDLLVKTLGSGGLGHIGILTARGVAENSSTEVGRLHGALGFRTRAQWGAFQLAARLPGDGQPATTYTLFVGGRQVATMPVIDGRSFCPVVRWAAALGFTPGWQDEPPRVLLDGQVVDAAPRIQPDGHAYLPVQVLAAAAGLMLTVDQTARTVTVGSPSAA